MRQVMSARELDRYRVGRSSRHALLDDGWDDLERGVRDGWAAIPAWGLSGWDLGEWPYVVISTRRRGTAWELRQVVEGDATTWRFASEEDRDAAVDYLFLWYGIAQEYSEWIADGIAGWDDDTRSYPARDALDAGELTVPDKYRGPFSWARLDAEKVDQ